jgi:hypothetical protein
MAAICNGNDLYASRQECASDVGKTELSVGCTAEASIRQGEEGRKATGAGKSRRRAALLCQCSCSRCDC